MYRNKAGMKTQEDYFTIENGSKERLEGYSTCVAYSQDEGKYKEKSAKIKDT